MILFGDIALFSVVLVIVDEKQEFGRSGLNPEICNVGII